MNSKGKLELVKGGKVLCVIVLPDQDAVIAMTANLREWRHFLKLRAAGTTGAPHPQMREVAAPLLKELQQKLPAVFDDITLTEE